MIIDFNTINFKNFINLNGDYWKVPQTNKPKIVKDPEAIGCHCLELDENSFIFTDCTNISDFGLNPFTIEYWVKPNPKKRGQNNYSIIFSSSLVDPTQSDSYFQFGINIYAQPFIEYSNLITGFDRVSGIENSSFDIFDGKWHKITCIRNEKGVISWYHNNTNLKTITSFDWSSINITSTHGSYVGNRYALIGNKQSNFAGRLHGLKIVKDIIIPK